VNPVSAEPANALRGEQVVVDPHTDFESAPDAFPVFTTCHTPPKLLMP